MFTSRVIGEVQTTVAGRVVDRELCLVAEMFGIVADTDVVQENWTSWRNRHEVRSRGTDRGEVEVVAEGCQSLGWEVARGDPRCGQCSVCYAGAAH